MILEKNLLNSRDPKLAEVMERIEEILKESDLSASIKLVSRTHSEHLLTLSSWSVLELDNDTLKLEIDVTDESGQDQIIRDLEDTAKVLHALCGMSIKEYNIAKVAIEMMSEVIEIDNTPQLSNKSIH